jgi:hypothetical protein
MGRLFVAFLFFLGLFLPQVTFAESEGAFEKRRCEEIFQLAEKIMASDFKPVTIKVYSASFEEALVNAAIVARNYIDTYEISPLLCKCLESIAYISEQERALLKSWNFTVEKSVDDDQVVTLEMVLDENQLRQLAFFNMWPLQFRIFKT